MSYFILDGCLCGTQIVKNTVCFNMLSGEKQIAKVDNEPNLFNNYGKCNFNTIEEGDIYQRTMYSNGWIKKKIEHE